MSNVKIKRHPEAAEHKFGAIEGGAYFEFDSTLYKKLDSHAAALLIKHNIGYRHLSLDCGVEADGFGIDLRTSVLWGFTNRIHVTPVENVTIDYEPA